MPRGLFWNVQAAKKKAREREELANALRSAYEPGADIPFEEDVGFETGAVPGFEAEPEGLIAGQEPGRVNIQNALAQMYQGPGDQPVRAWDLQQALQAQQAKTQTASAEPKKVQFIKYMENLSQANPKAYQRAMQAIRAQQILDLGGHYGAVVPGQVGVTAPVVGGVKGLKPGERPSVKGKQARAQKEAQLQVQKEFTQPKAESQAIQARGRGQFVTSMIDKAIEQISPLTAGPGAMTRGIPGTGAKDLSETLNTIRANLGFERLQEMRASSPTGGALGQVSEMENKLLQSVWGSLDQSQSPSQLKENLGKARQAVVDSWQRIADAYEKDYGKPMPTEGTPLAGVTLSPGETPQAPQSAINYLKQNDSPAIRNQFKAKYGYLPEGM